MPTDLSTPRWTCDICRTCYYADKAAAQRCEDAGPPDYLPDGELLLVSGRSAGWQLRPLTRAARIGTLTRQGRHAGHIAYYQIAGTADGGRPAEAGADSIWPHQPGRVQVYVQARGSGLGGLSAGAGGRAALAGWALQLAGLPAAGQPLHQHQLTQNRPPAKVRPLTPEVRAVLDLLAATAEHVRPREYGRPAALDVIAAEATSARDGLPDGSYNPARTGWWLARADPAAAAAQANQRIDAWRRGDPGTAPVPRLTAHARRGGGRLTRSKLRKDELAVIAAAGVEWPAGMSADGYLALLIRQTLEVPMTSTAAGSDSALFSTVPCRVAVHSGKGGVGKSTVAAALARAMAARGRNVLLADLNLANPALHVIFGLGPAEVDQAAGLIRGTAVTSRLRVFSHAQLAPPDRPADAVIGPEKAAEWVTFLAGVLDIRGTDVIVLDMPPGWDAVHQVVFDPYRTDLTGSVHVTTGHPLALRTETFPGRAAAGHRDHRWLVENLSRAAGPVIGSGQIAEIRLHGTGDDAVRDLAGQYGLHYAGSLPWEPDPAALAAAPEITALAGALLAERPGP